MPKHHAPRCTDCTVDMWDGDGIALCPLHAATPALLEALEGVLHEFDANDDNTISLTSADVARAAISAAKGETHA